MKKILPVFLCLLFAACLIQSSASEEVKAAGEVKKEVAKEEAPKASIKEWTKEEMLKDINQTLQSEREVLNYIPELKMSKEGAFTYQGVPLESLDKEKLEKVFARVRQQALLIRTNRMNRQMESIRQIQRTQNINRQMEIIRQTQSLNRSSAASTKAYNVKTNYTANTALPNIPKTPKVPQVPANTTRR